MDRSEKPCLISGDRDFNLIWKSLEDCGTRGMYYFDGPKRATNYSTFAEIFQKAGLAAGILKKFGINKGDRVLISSGTSMDLVYLWLAHIWIGAVPVPMPPREALPGGNNFQNRISNIIPTSSFYICYENEKEVIRAVYVEKKLGHRILTFSDLFNGLETGKADAPERVVPVDGDIAFIQFTSGSTGNPKGIMVSYKNLLTNIYDIWTRLRVDPDCLRAATWLPLYHDMGLVGFLLGCLFTTTELVLLSPQQFAKHPVQFLTLITDYKIEICGMPNFAMEWILRRFDPEDRNEFDLGSLKWIGIGAEPINMEKLRLFEDAFSRFGLKKGVLSPCYGLAEATLAVSIANPLEEYKVYRFNNILYPTNGKVLGDMEVKIEKQNNGDDFGLIKIKGNNVAEKAIINGKITGICDTNGFYNTMDIGLFLDDKLVVLGRYDDMFIVNGENFFPYEIESYIKNLKAVSRNRVVCFDVPASISPTGFTELILLYETPKLPVIEKAAMELEIDKTILKNTGLKLSKIIGVEPKTILVTPSGKIQRGLIRKRYLEGSLLK